MVLTNTYGASKTISAKTLKNSETISLRWKMHKIEHEGAQEWLHMNLICRGEVFSNTLEKYNLEIWKNSTINHFFAWYTIFNYFCDSFLLEQNSPPPSLFPALSVGPPVLPKQFSSYFKSLFVCKSCASCLCCCRFITSHPGVIIFSCFSLSSGSRMFM